MEQHYWARLGAGQISRRRVLRGAAVGGAGLAGAALIGCGGDDDAPAPAAPKGTSAAGASAAFPQGKPGGRLTAWLSGNPAAYDLHTIATSRTYVPISQAYNQIVQSDPAVAIDGPKSVIPDLATSWEIAPDGLPYSFKLVQNAKFHSGTPFTSADVQASLDRQRNPPKGVIALRQLQLEPIKTMETPDPYTIVLRMSRPSPSTTFLPILSAGLMSIYSKKDIDSGLDFSKNINGTGPYRFVEHRQDDRVTWDKNKDYHVAGRPYLDGIDQFVITDISAAAAQVQSGALQFTLSSTPFMPLTVGDLRKVMADKATYPTIVSLTGGFMHINTTRAPYSDVRVREAISLAIDKQARIQTTEGGPEGGVQGGLLLPGGNWALPLSEVHKIKGYTAYSEANVTKAKQLLSAAGVTQGHKLSIPTEDSVGEQASSLFIAQELKKIGLDAQVQAVTNAVSTERLLAQDYDIAPRSVIATIDDPDATWSQFFLTKSPGNYSKAGNQAIDDLFLKQATELNPERRFALVNDLERLTLPELGALSLDFGTLSMVIPKVVKNYVLHSSKFTNSRLQDVWLDR